jgi:hypothetical protein
MHRVRPAGRHDPRIVLVDRDDLVGDVPRRPARDEGCCVEDLVLHALFAHRGDIGVGLVDRIAGEEIEPAGDGEELLTRVIGDLTPRLERRSREPDVVRRGIAPPDDPRMILGCTSSVAELEPFEPDHADAATRAPVRGRRAEGAEPDDAEVVSVVGTAQRDALTSPRRSRTR